MTDLLVLSLSAESQQRTRLKPDPEPQCEKKCSCVCHLQRPGMKLMWVAISEQEHEVEEEELKQIEVNIVNEEDSESDEEAELDLYQSESSESDSSLNESLHEKKARFKATLNIIERQLRRKSDPGPEAVLHSLNSLPHCPPHLSKTHSASEEESIYEATIDLIAPPGEKSPTMPEFQVIKPPPALPPRIPLDKNKGRCAPRRVPLSPLSFQTPKLPPADLGSSERLQPVRAPPPPPARANDKRLSSLSQTCQGD